MVEEKKSSIYLLAIICIIAIVFIVFLVNNYVASHPTVSAQEFSAVGKAYDIAGANEHNAYGPGFSYETPPSDPTAYAYLRK